MSKTKQNLWVAAALLVGAAAAIAWTSAGSKAARAAAPKPDGPWIATAAWDLTAWSGPWGVSYAMNLTPDENTGIGSWSEETFVKALRTGKHMGQSRDILPPMPWHWISQASDDDLKAIYAYLRTIPPVKNRVPDAVIAPPPPPPAGGH